MSPQTLNLVIPQGTTLVKTFRFQHQLVLAKDLVPSISSPPTTLKINPLPVDLPSGYPLTFPLTGCDTVELITSGITAAGSQTVNIAPYAGTQALKCGASAATLPKDLTGQVWTGASKADYRLNKILQFSFLMTPLSGLITMKALASDTALLTPNCQYDQLPAPADQQKQIAYPADVWAKAYFWDAEYIFGGDTTRVLQGRLFVPAEATTA
jgi:hypothetical protein